MQTNNKIGLVRIKKGTDNATWRQCEEFLIEKGLFISSVPAGIMVLDIDRAEKEILKAKRGTVL